MNKDDNHTHESLHVFDSSLGSSYSGGVIFNYQQPYPTIDGFRVSSVTIFNYAGFTTSNVFYLLSSLCTAQTASRWGGIPQSLIATIPNNPTGPPANIDGTKQISYKLGEQTLSNVSFQLRDQNFNLLSGVRYSVSIIFNHCNK
jgi:hypothetical protein